jgi:CRISPR-associated endonuclease/helicase Cas3
VKQWLSEEATGDLADVEGGAAASGRTKGAMRPVLWWRGSEESRPVRRPDEIRPGMTIVVPYNYGGCDDWGWNPEYKGDVNDVGDAVKLAMERPMLRLHPRLADQWNYAEIAKGLRNAGNEREETLEGFSRTGPTGWVAETLQELSGGRWISAADGESYSAIVSRTVFDQSDGRSSYGREVRLDEHMRNCARLAARFAEGLSERLRRTVERAAATHDLGKADPRFQAWLRGGNPVRPDELIAKSNRNGQNRAAIRRARELSGYPKGGRHELTSTALLAARGEGAEDLDGDLLLHLVASHHGRCRPFAPVVADEEPVIITHEETSVSSKHDLGRVGSGVSERFWRLTRRYGWYGLAYLESLVRLADQRQSEAEQEKPGKAAHA